MRIIIGCDTFETGGAETFALRMARYYRERGHTVYLFAYLGDRIDHALVSENAGIEIPVLSFLPKGILNWLLYKLDGILFRFSIFLTLRRFLILRLCRQIIKQKNIQIVHTNLLGSLDVWCHAASHSPHVKIIHTIHGDLISYLYASIKNDFSELKATDRFYIKVLMPIILDRVNYFACPAEMHINIFKGFGFKHLERIRKIYHPVDVKFNISLNALTRESLFIPNDAIVFGSVARCTKKKGWEELIEAFLNVDIGNSYLLLVGDGEFLPYLKDRFKDFKNVLFVGNQPRPLQYIQLFDVGISASYFWESLPTAIIEYLAMGKPVICTDNAESKGIIESKSGPAGLVISVKKDELDVIEGDSPIDKMELKNALYQIYSDNELRGFLANNSKIAFKKFHKDLILGQYEELF